MPEVDEHTIKELIAHGVKSETEASQFYNQLADSLDNFIVKEKLEYIAGEETKHEKILRGLYRKLYGDEELQFPEKSIIPGLDFDVSRGEPLSEWLRKAMKSEEDSANFYRKVAKKFEDKDHAFILIYLADIEIGHYALLKVEVEMAGRFEDYDKIVPLVHIGA